MSLTITELNPKSAAAFLEQDTLYTLTRLRTLRLDVLSAKTSARNQNMKRKRPAKQKKCRNKNSNKVRLDANRLLCDCVCVFHV